VQTTIRTIEKQENENIPKIVVQDIINMGNIRRLNLAVVKPKTLAVIKLPL
jgi:hypothetical protein